MSSQLKVEHLGGNDFEVLGLQAESSDFCSMWLGVGNFSVYIRRKKEGIEVELYERKFEDRNPIARMYADDYDLTGTETTDGN